MKIETRELILNVGVTSWFLLVAGGLVLGSALVWREIAERPAPGSRAACCPVECLPDTRPPPHVRWRVEK